MKINELKSGVILSYITQGIHLVISIFYTPIMLRLLGQNEYGLLQLVSSVVSYLSLLNMGFSSGYIRFYSRYKANDGDDKIPALNGMFMIIFTTIALICLFCGGIMFANADVIFGNKITASELSRAKILLVISVCNMAISFVGNVFSCNINAQEKFFFQRIIALFQTILNPFLTLLILLMGYGSLGVIAISTAWTILAIGTNIWYSVSKLGFKIKFEKFNIPLFKEMWVFTFFIFINMIVDQINWNVDKFLIGRMFGTKEVSIYSIAAQLNSIYMTFSVIISAVFAPRVNMMAEGKNDTALTKLFTKVGRVQLLVVGLIISGYVLFGKTFITLWVGKEYEAAYLIGVLLMVPVTVPLIQNLGIEIQRAKNLHHFRSYLYLGMAFVNVFISIGLIKLYGPLGAPIGTAASLVLCNGLIMNIYYHKKIKLNILYFWKEILKFGPAAFVAVGCGCGIKILLLQESWPTLVLCIVGYSIVYSCSFWFLGMNQEEKELISNPLKKMVAKYAKNSR